MFSVAGMLMLTGMNDAGVAAWCCSLPGGTTTCW